MPAITSPNPRLTGPLPRRDILAVCAFLNRRPCTGNVEAASEGAEILLDRLAAAARMQ
jgi:hypothetical protein